MSKTIILGHIVTFITVAVWGVTFINSKLLLTAFEPIEILFDRFVLGFAAMWLLPPRFLKVKSIKDELYMAAAGLLGITLYFLCENTALVYSKASNVGIIIASIPFFSGLTDRFLGSRAKLNLNFFLGFVMAMAGIGLLTFSSLDKISFNPIGDGLALLACITWALYCLFVHKALNSGYPSLELTRHIFGYGLIFMLPVMYFMDYELKWDRLIEPFYGANLLFLGLCASALGYVGWSYGVRCIGVVKTSAYLYISPVITVVAAVIVLDESLSFLGVTGMILTMSGLLISQLDKHRRQD